MKKTLEFIKGLWFWYVVRTWYYYFPSKSDDNEQPPEA